MGYAFFFFNQLSESVSGTKFEEDHLSHYSPWSCGTIGSYMNAIESEPRDVIANSSAVLMVRFRGWEDVMHVDSGFKMSEYFYLHCCYKSELN